MATIQVQGVHHLTFVGSNRQAVIEFYQGILGMRMVLDQPNLDVPGEEHLLLRSRRRAPADLLRWSHQGERPGAQPGRDR